VSPGVWTVFADGASRGNPGPASIGVAVCDPSGREVHSISQRIGRATSSEAEYRAAIAGLEAALALAARAVDLRTDSTLVVRHLQHRLPVRNQRLRPLFERLVDLRRRFESLSVTPVSRVENERADALAHQALDRADS
jgi:ribonuclease HI